MSHVSVSGSMQQQKNNNKDISKQFTKVYTAGRFHMYIYTYKPNQGKTLKVQYFISYKNCRCSFLFPAT